MIFAIQDEINKLALPSKLEFTLFHSDLVNYLQVPPWIVKETADKIADVIGGTGFPPSLGLVGMPYSQSEGFLMNCLLTHEMAHVAYQDFYSVDVSKKVDSVLQALVDETKTLADRDIILSRGTLERWTEEVFCDLFAISLIGPAYTFALIELTGATLLAGSSTTMLDPFYSFMEYHPAEIARFNTHLKLLKKLGWWTEMKKISSCYIEVLSVSAARISDLRIETEIPPEIGGAKFLAAFFELCDWLITFVAKKVRTSANAIPNYRRQAKTISEYLRQAVVPSTIVVRGNTEHPSPIVLINSAFRFYPEHIPDLIRNVENREPGSVKDRSELTERLELWSLKALEDCRLLSGRGGASSHGSSS
jgi:hypothetical protein